MEVPKEFVTALTPRVHAIENDILRLSRIFSRCPCVAADQRTPSLAYKPKSLRRRGLQVKWSFLPERFVFWVPYLWLFLKKIDCAAAQHHPKMRWRRLNSWPSHLSAHIFFSSSAAASHWFPRLVSFLSLFTIQTCNPFSDLYLEDQSDNQAANEYKYFRHSSQYRSRPGAQVAKMKIKVGIARSREVSCQCDWYHSMRKKLASRMV